MVSAGLYIHSPFCVHKCGYCDFNSWAEEALAPQKRWLAALEKQIDFWAERLSPCPVTFDTIFFGGGTPSLLDNDILIRLGEILRKRFCMSEDLEFSVEVNPETVDLAKLGALKALGANRISMGVQSFDDHYLKILERKASYASVVRSLELIRANWEGRFSFDLMYGLPEQSVEASLKDLAEALRWQTKHLSTYQLTLNSHRSKKWKQPPEDLLLEMTEAGEDLMSRAGLEKYEISNFAHAGEESRHNLKYWNLEPFLGIGPGAAGLLSGALLGLNGEENRFGFHQKQADNFDVWEQGAGLKAFEDGGLKKRQPMEHLEEMLMMGLRLKGGILNDRLPLAAQQALKEFGDLGFFQASPKSWYCSERGERLLDGLLPKIYRKIEEIAGPDLDSSQIDPKF